MKSFSILMCTYNGSAYLNEQLDSIVLQNYSNWSLFVSDDGSTDETLNILHEFIKNNPQRIVNVSHNSNVGYARNFMSLICDLNVISDFYALSDQDDYWFRNKLYRAYEKLNKIPADIPAVYGTSTLLTDNRLIPYSLSNMPHKEPNFESAFVQTCAGGNTIVFNHAARKLLINAGMNHPIHAHDWWIFFLISACGGVICYDKSPSLLYRQHSSNLVGSNKTFRGKVMRISNLLNNNYKNWITQNITGVLQAKKMIDLRCLSIIEDFLRLRDANIFSRIYGFYHLKLWRHGLYGRLQILLLFLLRKI